MEEIIMGMFAKKNEDEKRDWADVPSADQVTGGSGDDELSERDKETKDESIVFDPATGMMGSKEDFSKLEKQEAEKEAVNQKTYYMPAEFVYWFNKLKAESRSQRSQLAISKLTVMNTSGDSEKVIKVLEPTRQYYINNWANLVIMLISYVQDKDVEIVAENEKKWYAQSRKEAYRTYFNKIKEGKLDEMLPWLATYYGSIIGQADNAAVKIAFDFMVPEVTKGENRELINQVVDAVHKFHVENMGLAEDSRENRVLVNSYLKAIDNGTIKESREWISDAIRDLQMTYLTNKNYVESQQG